MRLILVLLLVSACVRNSGAVAVVEGVGDHGCEYMTGGRVVILGETGRDFAAGMSGGIAYILDDSGTFPSKVNPGHVELEAMTEEDLALVKEIERHVSNTDSQRGLEVLQEWGSFKTAFVKVMPKSTDVCWKPRRPYCSPQPPERG